jgi:VanZ family protein
MSIEADRAVAAAVPAWRRLAWGLLLALWTVALLTPQPVELGHEVLPEEAAFPVAKGLHVGVYAFLTATSAWLGVRGGRRWLLPLALLLHGGLTEYLQTFVPLRIGCWQDVAIDAGGIALGLALTWRRWFGRAG